MISVENLTVEFSARPLFHDVSFVVNDHDRIALVGKNGAGKSTLLQILGTLDLPTDAQKHGTEITIAGEPFLKMNDQELSKFRNENIGFVFQHHQLLPEFTAIENVMMPIRIAGKNPKDFQEKAYQLFEELNIVDRRYHKPKALSGGEAQRVAVVRALINSPKIIFADEPTGNLDSKNADSLHQLLFDLRDRYNQTFVIITHNPILAESADRKLVMKDGIIL